MGIISWAIIGLIAGALARFIMPGKDPGGLFITMLLGVAGGMVGGYLGSRMGIGTVNAIDLKSILIATGGAVIILLIYRALKKK